MASLIYSLLSPSLIIFLLNINSIFSPPIYKGKLIGVLAVKIFLFINNKGELTDIGDFY